MLGEQIGEFKGKNIGWRVLPDGKIETTAEGTGRIFGMDVWLISTSVGTMANGIFIGEVNSMMTTMTGDSVMMKGNAVAWSTGNGGGTTRVATINTSQAQKLARLNKVIALHEYDTDRDNNYNGKIWEWK
jgi:hypothetical protein